MLPKRENRIDFFLSRPFRVAPRAGTVGTEGDRRDAGALDAKGRRGRRVTRSVSSAKGVAWNGEAGKDLSLALLLWSPPNEMEFSGERSESAATTG